MQRLPIKGVLLFLLLGIVTLFYLALLSQRALTLVTYGEFPPLELACDMPLFNWTHPQLLPEDVINPLKPDFAGKTLHMHMRCIHAQLIFVFLLDRLQG